MYEAGKALITETLLVKFSVITIQQNFILLPMFVLYEMSLLPDISNQANNAEKKHENKIIGCLVYHLNGYYLLRLPLVTFEWLSPKMPRKKLSLLYIVSRFLGSSNFIGARRVSERT
jgi:hypothetical protein